MIRGRRAGDSPARFCIYDRASPKYVSGYVEITDRYDVVIVGAGPGGAAAGHYLAQRGLKVVLLDKFDFPRDKTCGDGLTPRAVAALDDLGIVKDLRRVGRLIHGFEIFAPNGRSTGAPIPLGDSLPNYALTVPRLILDNLIRERALASGAAFEGQVRVSDIERGAGGVVVKGDRQGRPVSVKGQVAVVATGASTALLLRMGILRQRPPVMLAARAYFDGLTGIADRLQLRFDGVPLPGYGWIFPLSDRSANIGVGYFPTNRAARRLPATSRAAFDAFLEIAPLREMLRQARRVGPVKGFPLRVDFLSATTFDERVLLVGEAAGLVNPLTGEGIDYALESGRLAADQIAGMFATGDLSRQSFEAYDRRLREHFQSLFRFSIWVRDWLLHRWILNRLTGLANRRPDLKTRLTKIGLGYQEAPDALSLRTVLKVASVALGG